MDQSLSIVLMIRSFTLSFELLNTGLIISNPSNLFYSLIMKPLSILMDNINLTQDMLNGSNSYNPTRLFQNTRRDQLI